MAGSFAPGETVIFPSIPSGRGLGLGMPGTFVGFLAFSAAFLAFVAAFLAAFVWTFLWPFFWAFRGFLLAAFR